MDKFSAIERAAKMGKSLFVDILSRLNTTKIWKKVIKTSQNKKVWDLPRRGRLVTYTGMPCFWVNWFCDWILFGLNISIWVSAIFWNVNYIVDHFSTIFFLIKYLLFLHVKTNSKKKICLTISKFLPMFRQFVLQNYINTNINASNVPYFGYIVFTLM